MKGGKTKVEFPQFHPTVLQEHYYNLKNLSTLVAFKMALAFQCWKFSNGIWFSHLIFQILIMSDASDRQTQNEATLRSCRRILMKCLSSKKWNASAIPERSIQKEPKLRQGGNDQKNWRGNWQKSSREIRTSCLRIHAQLSRQVSRTTRSWIKYERRERRTHIRLQWIAHNTNTYPIHMHKWWRTQMHTD